MRLHFPDINGTGPDAVWNEVEEKQQTLVENLYFLRPYPNDFHQLR